MILRERRVVDARRGLDFLWRREDSWRRTSSEGLSSSDWRMSDEHDTGDGAGLKRDFTIHVEEQNVRVSAPD